MIEKQPTLVRAGIPEDRVDEAIAAITDLSTKTANTKDAYLAIINWLYINFPTLNLTGNLLFDLVRRGTKGTPYQCLEQWKISLHHKTVSRIAHGDAPPEFMQKLSEIGIDLYHETMNYAQASLELERQRIESAAAEKIESAEHKADKAEGAASEAESRRVEAEQRAVAEQDGRERAQQALAAERTTTTSLLDQKRDLEHRLNESESRNAQERHDHQRTLSEHKTAHEKETTYFNGQIRYLNEQLDQARQQAKQQHERALLAEQSNTSIQTELRLLNSQLERQEQQHKETLIRRDTESADLNLRLDAAQSESRQLAERLSSVSAGLQAAELRANELRTDNEQLRKDLAAANSRLDAALAKATPKNTPSKRKS